MLHMYKIRSSRVHTFKDNVRQIGQMNQISCRILLASKLKCALLYNFDRPRAVLAACAYGIDNSEETLAKRTGMVVGLHELTS